ncbi:hypothetical protein Tco_0599681 [Tanacetum coccineum]
MRNTIVRGSLDIVPSIRLVDLPLVLDCWIHNLSIFMQYVLSQSTWISLLHLQVEFLISFYMAVRCLVLCCLAAGCGRMAEHESYTSFGGSMLIAFYLALMIFRICCLAADSGRMVECEYCSPQQPP